MTVDLAQDLGEVKGKLDMLIRMVEQSDREAAESRAHMRDKVGALDRRMIKVESAVDDIKPVTDRVKRWEQRGAGAAAVALAIAGFFGSAVTALLPQIWNWLFSGKA